MQTASTRFTCSIRQDLMDFVNEESEKLKKAKREIIEKALGFYRKEKRKREIIAGYNEMADDKEEMAMWLSIANNPANLVWND